MNRPVHFEIHSADPAKAIDFFAKVLGWHATKWDGPEEYWLVTTGPDSKPGINGGLMKSRDGQPRTVNTVQVDNVDVTAKVVVENGGQIVVPKMAIPGVGWLAYCSDPTGNIFGITHPDPMAK